MCCRKVVLLAITAKQAAMDFTPASGMVMLLFERLRKWGIYQTVDEKTGERKRVEWELSWGWTGVEQELTLHATARYVKCFFDPYCMFMHFIAMHVQWLTIGPASSLSLFISLSDSISLMRDVYNITKIYMYVHVHTFVHVQYIRAMLRF